MAKAQTIMLPAGTKVPDHVAMILDGNRRWARARGLQPWEGHKAGYEAVHRLAKAARQLGVHTFTVWAFSTENWERSEREREEIFRVFRVALSQAEKEVHEEKVRFVQLGRKDRLPKDILERLVKLEESTKDYSGHLFNVALDYGEYYFEQDHLPDFTPEKLKEAVLDYSRRRRRFGGNDAVEHLKFNPKIVARLEMDLKQELTSDRAIAYVREQYGLSKELARMAGGHLLTALREGRREEWEEAKVNLRELYGIVKKNLGLAFEPEVLANIEVNLWRNPSEEDTRHLLAETFRFSAFQAGKAAHLSVLANREPDAKKARGYWEKFYQALKERVA